MPREPQPLIRKRGFKDPEKYYIIACEGTLTEYIYFGDLRASDLFNDSGLIDIIPIEHPKNIGTSPLELRTLIRTAKKDKNFRKNDEFWIISDRDDWATMHHINFDQFAEECRKEQNTFWALSNPCFEIWLLLHLKDISDYSDSERQKIFQNKKISQKKNYIDSVLANAIGNGRGYTKYPPKEFLMPNIKTAVRRAKALSKRGELYPHFLGTDVYKLVKKLIK